MSQKKKFQIPHVFVILVMIVIFATAMTYIIPAGEFARVKNEATGKMIVDATSFTWVEQCPVSFFKIPNYIVKALAGSSLIWMTIFSAASIEVILATGAFDAAINDRNNHRIWYLRYAPKPGQYDWIYSGTCPVLSYVWI